MTVAWRWAAGGFDALEGDYAAFPDTTRARIRGAYGTSCGDATRTAALKPLQTLNEEGPAAGRCRLDESISRVVMLYRPIHCLAVSGSDSPFQDNESTIPDILEI